MHITWYINTKCSYAILLLAKQIIYILKQSHWVKNVCLWYCSVLCVFNLCWKTADHQCFECLLLHSLYKQSVDCFHSQFTHHHWLCSDFNLFDCFYHQSKDCLSSEHLFNCHYCWITYQFHCHFTICLYSLSLDYWSHKFTYCLHP